MTSDHPHDPGHDHDHARTFQPDLSEPTSDAALIGVALRRLMIERGVYSAEEERATIERMAGANPGNGARIVARAWSDPAFKERLLADGAEAIKELGYDLSPLEFTVLENTDRLHNVVVCTLCSCYPRALLGQSPAWYKSKNYRARVVREPRAVLAEFGVALADDVEVRVHDSTAELRYMILPQRPAGTEGLDEADLAALVTRDSLIGTQRDLTPKDPAAR
ncbi:nitrile hydratase [Tistlia consotensis]|uniref:Nitrile hydratase n=1 Tax=Tistlia consotensis USBA 355 TaxID=560819 RepID=A0A1Y6CL45_9PROT|nr:nitrile hydratase subunit alpha [Tistlia consotensis]SMF72921.1 nitrile hydratase [Tistlia consotensis USBA 355]SNS09919.1 nitrile hydratase [Tistlia consotensis]